MFDINVYKKLKAKYNFDNDSKFEEHKHIRAPKGTLIIGKTGDEKGKVIAGGGRWVKKDEILNADDPAIAKAIEEQMKDAKEEEPEEDDEEYKKENYESHQEGKGFAYAKKMLEGHMKYLRGTDGGEEKVKKLQDVIEETGRNIELENSMSIMEASSNLSQMVSKGINIHLKSFSKMFEKIISDNIKSRMFKKIIDSKGINLPEEINRYIENYDKNFSPRTTNSITEKENPKTNEEEKFKILKKLNDTINFSHYSEKSIEQIKLVLKESKEKGIDISKELKEKINELIDKCNIPYKIYVIYSSKEELGEYINMSKLRGKLKDMFNNCKDIFQLNSIISLSEKIGLDIDNDDMKDRFTYVFEKCDDIEEIEKILTSSIDAGIQLDKGLISKKLKDLFYDSDSIYTLEEVVKNMKNNSVDISEGMIDEIQSKTNSFLDDCEYAEELANILFISKRLNISVDYDKVEYKLNDYFLKGCDNPRFLIAIMNTASIDDIELDEDKIQELLNTFFEENEDNIENFCDIMHACNLSGCFLDDEIVEERIKNLLSNCNTYDDYFCLINGINDAMLYSDDIKHLIFEGLDKLISSDDGNISDFIREKIENEDYTSEEVFKISSEKDQIIMSMILGKDCIYGFNHYRGDSTAFVNKYLYQKRPSWKNDIESNSRGNLRIYNLIDAFEDNGCCTEWSIEGYIQQSIEMMDNQMKRSPFNLEFRREVSSGELGYAIGIEPDMLQAATNMLKNADTKEDREYILQAIRNSVKTKSWINPCFQSVTWDFKSVFDRPIRLDYKIKEGTEISCTSNLEEKEFVIGRDCQCEMDLDRIYWDEELQKLSVPVICSPRKDESGKYIKRTPVERIIYEHMEEERKNDTMERERSTEEIKKSVNNFEQELKRIIEEIKMAKKQINSNADSKHGNSYNMIRLFYLLKKKYNLDAENKYEEGKHFRAPKGALMIGLKGKEKGKVIGAGGRWVSKDQILNADDPTIAKAIEEQIGKGEDESSVKEEEFEEYDEDEVEEKLKDHIDELGKTNPERAKELGRIYDECAIRRYLRGGKYEGIRGYKELEERI